MLACVLTGKALTAWSAASVTGPMGLAALRGYEERKAIDGLLAEVDPTAFEQTFGAPLSISNAAANGGHAEAVVADSSAAINTLIEAKTITISRLVEMAPAGTQDPTPFLYDSTCFAAAALLGTVRPCPVSLAGRLV